MATIKVGKLTNVVWTKVAQIEVSPRPGVGEDPLTTEVDVQLLERITNMPAVEGQTFEITGTSVEPAK